MEVYKRCFFLRKVKVSELVRPEKSKYKKTTESTRTEITAHVYLCIFASRVSQLISFSNERYTLLLWTIIADWIQFAIFRQAVKPHDGEGI